MGVRSLDGVMIPRYLPIENQVKKIISEAAIFCTLLHRKHFGSSTLVLLPSNPAGMVLNRIHLVP